MIMYRNMRERACLGVGILRLCWGRRRVAFTPLALATGPKFRKSSVYAVLRAKCWSGFAGTQIPKPSTGAALRVPSFASPGNKRSRAQTQCWCGFERCPQSQYSCGFARKPAWLSLS